MAAYNDLCRNQKGQLDQHDCKTCFVKAKRKEGLLGTLPRRAQSVWGEASASSSTQLKAGSSHQLVLQLLCFHYTNRNYITPIEISWPLLVLEHSFFVSFASLLLCVGDHLEDSHLRSLIEVMSLSTNGTRMFVQSVNSQHIWTLDCK